MAPNGKELICRLRGITFVGVQEYYFNAEGRHEALKQVSEERPQELSLCCATRTTGNMGVGAPVYT